MLLLSIKFVLFDYINHGSIKQKHFLFYIVEYKVGFVWLNIDRNYWLTNLA